MVKCNLLCIGKRVGVKKKILFWSITGEKKRSVYGTLDHRSFFLFFFFFLLRFVSSGFTTFVLCVMRNLNTEIPVNGFRKWSLTTDCGRPRRRSRTNVRHGWMAHSKISWQRTSMGLSARLGATCTAEHLALLWTTKKIPSFLRHTHPQSRLNLFG